MDDDRPITDENMTPEREKFLAQELADNPQLYTYDDIAKIFHVSKNTVTLWRMKGLLKVLGYFKIDSNHKRAVFSHKEVIRLITAKILPPDTFKGGIKRKPKGSD